jgi:hypothetical protein
MTEKYIDQDGYPSSKPGEGRVVLVIKPEHAVNLEQIPDNQ